ncbi:bifunctional phosphoribosyl-AMP cyclohydrolase/phosphoribosyl-ATP diphosphatase HisIE [Helicobacter sp. 23-1044]
MNGKADFERESSAKIEAILDKIAWNKSPLIPTIAQDSHTKEVLMLAYSNAESLRLSLQKGIAHYFSRSKNRIWQKGEESGNTQKISEIYIDCDNDAILFCVNQKGFACHTGNVSCFFKKVDLEDLAIDSQDLREVALDSPKNPYHIIDNLYHALQERKFESPDKSYTAKLYAKGQNAICKKIIEESGEVCFAIKDFLRESKNTPPLTPPARGGEQDDCPSLAEDKNQTLPLPCGGGQRGRVNSRESKAIQSDNVCHSDQSEESQKNRDFSPTAQNDKHSNLPQTPAQSVIYESADLIYHLLVGLSYCDISPNRVMDELKRRFGTSGIDEKNSRQNR